MIGYYGVSFTILVAFANLEFSAQSAQNKAHWARVVALSYKYSI